MSEPKKGDVVKLKSGGPEMTFEGHPRLSVPLGGFIIDDNQAVCAWFDGPNVKTYTFCIRALEKIERGAGRP